jgi:aminoglycoside/choline kinase family phosphotransferase
MQIPTDPDALTAGWLTSALRQGGAIDKAAVAAFKAEPLAEDKGFYGQISRLSLEYDLAEADAPRSLIAKFASATPEMRQRSIPSYEREVRFYQQLARQTTLPTPTCYYGDIDTETGFHILLLQDLAPARSGSRVEGASPDQAELAIRHIARFHATWWESPQLEEISWLLATTTKFDYDGLEARHNQWWPEFYRQAKHRLPDSIKEIGARLGRRRADIIRHLASPPQTLIHSDYQLDNLIFGTSKGDIPFAVVDWQFVRRGRGIWDVAYFLSQNLEPDDRRTVETDLLRAYHQILLDNDIQGYTFAQCLHDYRLSLLHRLGALISTIAAMPFTQEQIQMHIDVLLPRCIAAILDHQAGELLT